jgi:hypothetical protein
MDIDGNSDIVFGGYGSDLNFEVFSSVTGNNKANSYRTFIVYLSSTTGTYYWAKELYKSTKSPTMVLNIKIS